MLHIYARGVYNIHLRFAIPTPALPGSGSLGLISASVEAPHAKNIYLFPAIRPYYVISFPSALFRKV